MNPLTEDQFVRRARDIRWLLSDVDGVLTDGRLYYSEAGEALKAFHVRDGLALQLAQRAGIRVGLLSAKGSPALERRAADLGLDETILGRHDKGVALDEFLDRYQLTAQQLAYIGDDLTDLAVLERCGLPFAPADAAREVRAAAITLSLNGGCGAVREAVERLLKARGQWQSMVSTFTAES